MVEEEATSGPRFRLLYDGRCGLCGRFAGPAGRLDRQGRLALLPFDDPLAAVDLARLPDEKRYSAFHLVAPAGRIRSGEEAVLPTLDLLAGGKELAAVLRLAPGGELAVRGAYRWVARNRTTLERLFPDSRDRRKSCDVERDGG
ncbi:MAG: DUF393 domain-containing protein [Actinobacteria bacterium]|nr:DUF393 domain-containing protein [Actinomycetota bacterium]